MVYFTCQPLGDTAITVTFGDGINSKINNRVHQATRVLSDPPLPGLLEVVPAYASLTVYYGYGSHVGGCSSYQAMVGMISERLKNLKQQEGTMSRLVHIPVCYEVEFAPDLEQVANRCNLTLDEVVELHCQPDYQVFFLGFMPGFAYLGGMDCRLATPRKESPRVQIPAGAVGIAGNQTGIYPLASPGGWQLIGQTPVSLVDFKTSPPAVLQAGDRVRFFPISSAEFQNWGCGL